MFGHALFQVGGEFRDRGRERAFQAERFPESYRQARLLFLLSAGLNTLFLASDWRFHGDPHFWVAVPARLFVVLASIACVLGLRRAVRFAQIEALTVGWAVCTSVGVAFLVSSRSDLALFVVLLLPSIIYMVAPISFRRTLCLGVGCSVLMLLGYLGAGPLPATLLGLLLVLVVMNAALTLVLIHGNRLRRLEWSATQAERQAKEELVASQVLVERLFMAVPIPLVVASRYEGRIIRVNDAARAYLGADPAEAGVRIADVFTDRAGRRALLRRLQQSGYIDGFEASLRSDNGGLRDVLITATLLSVDKEPAVVAGVVDITERKAAEAETRWQATHDALTSLPNRLDLHLRLGVALQRLSRPGGGAGLFLVDLDDFKAINDTLGHDAGDELLVQAAARLRDAVEPPALVARLGGDEFAVLVPRRLEQAEAEAYAQALMEALRRPFDRGGQSMATRASIGIALAPQHELQAVELMKAADLALYRAKAQGRNVAVIYDPGMRAAMVERVTICRAVGLALEEGRILPFYQPQIDLASGRVVGIEALARWKHPERGIVPAAAFHRAFEDAEIARGVSAAVLDAAVRDLRQWTDAGLEPPRIYVNLAPAVFRDADPAAQILETLARAGVAPAQMGVEVSETVLVARGSTDVERALIQLQQAGMRVALDDFGTGLASLTRLERVPIDAVKIDRGFVREIESIGASAAIVRAVIGFAVELGRDVIAEGVETAGQEDFLREAGCGIVQGYRYARPVPAGRVPWLLTHGSLLPKDRPRSGGASGIVAA